VGDQIKFDVSVTKGAAAAGWNEAGAVGTLTLVAPMALVEIHQASAAPKIDGTEDAVWASASSVETGKQAEGTGPATAVVKTLWKGDTLYVLMKVTDAKLDDTASNPWDQDSIEIYVDNLNAKAGAYRADDTQIRINYKNSTSFGSGDEAAQKARLTSATKVVAGGYVVEASITLLGAGAANASIGVDFQVNDGEGGVRIGVRKWAEAANQGYQGTTDWGVGKLLPE
jgi:endo-1,4-beta-xylanase